MIAAVAGGTGLVGSAVLDELSARGMPATAFARREGAPRPGLHWRVGDIAALRAVDIPPDTNVGLCCLGTTIKAAGDREAFRGVDHGLVLAFANACRKAGVATFAVVSAAGADPRSRVFYSRTKGEMERDLARVGFRSLSVLRPGLLLGEREERRPLERASIRVVRAPNPLLPRAWRGAEARVVARALLTAAAQAQGGVRIVGNAEIARLGTP